MYRLARLHSITFPSLVEAHDYANLTSGKGTVIEYRETVDSPWAPAFVVKSTKTLGFVLPA